MEQELARLEALTDLQLVELLGHLEDDPAPQEIRQLIANRVAQIFNDRLGIRAHLEA